MRQFGLEELVTPSLLRHNLHAAFRRHADVRGEAAIRTLIAKGRIELEECERNFKQRHHVLADWVVGPERAQERARETLLAERAAGSPFLAAFLGRRGGAGGAPGEVGTFGNGEAPRRVG